MGAFSGGDQARGEFARTTPRSPRPNGSQGNYGISVAAFPPMTLDEEYRQDITSRPQISEASPSIAEMDEPDSYGGSMSQKTRTRKIVREKRGSETRRAESGDLECPVEGRAHLPRDVGGAALSISGNGPDPPKDFRAETKRRPRNNGRAMSTRNR